MIIDHLGLAQPFEPPAPAEPFAELPKVLALAAYPNVVVKISGACTLAQRSAPWAGCRVCGRLPRDATAGGWARPPEVVRNLTFDGPDFRTFYLTPGSSLSTLEVQTPGIGLRSSCGIWPGGGRG